MICERQQTAIKETPTTHAGLHLDAAGLRAAGSGGAARLTLPV